VRQRGVVDALRIGRRRGVKSSAAMSEAYGSWRGDQDGCVFLQIVRCDSNPVQHWRKRDGSKHRDEGARAVVRRARTEVRCSCTLSTGGGNPSSHLMALRVFVIFTSRKGVVRESSPKP
jgi:hypothetical protein